MAADEVKSQSRHIFKSDDEVLLQSLKEFKNERAIFVQEVIEVDGGFAFSERHFFDQHADMSKWLWDIPGTSKYVAVAVSDTEQMLTYSGKKFVMSYANIASKPEVTYYASFSKLPKYKINESALKESVSEIVSSLKGE